MTEELFFDTLRQGLWIAVIISTPILAVALIAGLVVGLFQALTSIQEMTLTFVPKLLAILVVFWVSMGFMTTTLTSFFTRTLVPLIAEVSEMDNAIYATITRQSGLRSEMQVIANNIANASTDGYRKEGLIFSEYVKAMETRDTSLSMARAEARMIDRTQGQLAQTDGQFDFAIDGDGYFMVETPDGPALTRAGHFQPGPDGELVTAEGYRLLDAGQAPIFITPDATSVGLSADGTLSIDGRAEAQLGLFLPADPNDLNRGAGVLFTTEGEIVPAETGRMIQGFLEASNVEPVQEVARMIEVQRAYEQGSRFMAAEDDRIRSVIDTLGR